MYGVVHPFIYVILYLVLFICVQDGHWCVRHFLCASTFFLFSDIKPFFSFCFQSWVVNKYSIFIYESHFFLFSKLLLLHFLFLPIFSDIISVGFCFLSIFKDENHFFVTSERLSNQICFTIHWYTHSDLHKLQIILIA